jgi:S-adenosylmethionine decarboxylase
MEITSFDTSGRHLLLDLWGLDFETANDATACSHHAQAASEKAGMKVLSVSLVPFRPQGFSLAVILSTSHLAIHSAPEFGYLSVDVFTCGPGDPLVAAKYLIGVLGPKQYFLTEIKRGNPPQSVYFEPEQFVQKEVAHVH